MTPTLDILPGYWPHVLTLVKVSKNTQMNYHTESVSQHVDHFKLIKNFGKNIGKKLIIFHEGGGRYPFVENSVKLINLIFEPFPYYLSF